MPGIKRLLQRIEGIGQRALLRSVSYPARRRPIADLSGARRILVIRHDAIGDMVMSTGFFRRIKEERPEIEIDVLASPSNGSVLAGLPHVRKIFTHRRGRFLEFPRLRADLQAERYDAVLDGRVIWPKLGTDTAFTMLASGAPRRIGIGGRINDYVYTDRVDPPGESHFIEHMAALTKPLGIDPTAGDWRPMLCISAGEREAATRLWANVAGTGPKLLVNISAGTQHRRWPADKFASALRVVRDAAPDARVLVMAPPHEFDKACDVAAIAAGVPCQPGIREAFAVVEQSDVVWTPDTSIGHAASAFGTTTVAMQLKGMVNNFRPWRTPGQIVAVDSLSLEDLAVEPVAAAVVQALADVRLRGPSRRPL